MKKLFVILCAVMMTLNLAAKGEQVVLVDMDYIMSAIPAYETANEQLDQISKKWQKEVEAILIEVQTMYKNYQTELVFLSDEMKNCRTDNIHLNDGQKVFIISAYVSGGRGYDHTVYNDTDGKTYNIMGVEVKNVE